MTIKAEHISHLRDYTDPANIANRMYQPDSIVTKDTSYVEVDKRRLVDHYILMHAGSSLDHDDEIIIAEEILARFSNEPIQEEVANRNDIPTLHFSSGNFWIKCAFPYGMSELQKNMSGQEDRIEYGVPGITPILGAGATLSAQELYSKLSLDQLDQMGLLSRLDNAELYDMVSDDETNSPYNSLSMDVDPDLIQQVVKTRGLDVIKEAVDLDQVIRDDFTRLKLRGHIGPEYIVMQKGIPLKDDLIGGNLNVAREFILFLGKQYMLESRLIRTDESIKHHAQSDVDFALFCLIEDTRDPLYLDYVSDSERALRIKRLESIRRLSPKFVRNLGPVCPAPDDGTLGNWIRFGDVFKEIDHGRKHYISTWNNPFENKLETDLGRGRSPQLALGRILADAHPVISRNIGREARPLITNPITKWLGGQPWPGMERSKKAQSWKNFHDADPKTPEMIAAIGQIPVLQHRERTNPEARGISMDLITNVYRYMKHTQIPSTLNNSK